MSRMNIDLVWSLATETTHFFTSTPSFLWSWKFPTGFTGLSALTTLPTESPLLLEQVVERHFALDILGVCVFLNAARGYVRDMDGLAGF